MDRGLNFPERWGSGFPAIYNIALQHDACKPEYKADNYKNILHIYQNVEQVTTGTFLLEGIDKTKRLQWYNSG